MAVTLSKGHVNLYSLAKNAGTSVNQIERFYARNLPFSAELVEIYKALERPTDGQSEGLLAEH
jgi:hypothetical protein